MFTGLFLFQTADGEVANDRLLEGGKLKISVDYIGVNARVRGHLF